MSQKRILSKKIAIPLIASVVLILVLFLLNVLSSYIPAEVPFKKLAVQTENESVCNLIPTFSPRHKMNCYTAVALSTNNPKACKKLFDKYKNDADAYSAMEWEETCYGKLVEKTQNLDICSKIPSGGWKSRGISFQEECYLYFVKRRKEEAICEQIENTEVKDVCYRELAPLRKEGSLCQRIENVNERNWCYRYTARETEDISLCEKIKDKEDKGHCYFGVALQKDDRSICKMIEVDYIKEDCYASTGW